MFVFLVIKTGGLMLRCFKRRFRTSELRRRNYMSRKAIWIRFQVSAMFPVSQVSDASLLVDESAAGLPTPSCSVG